MGDGVRRCLDCGAPMVPCVVTWFCSRECHLRRDRDTTAEMDAGWVWPALAGDDTEPG